MGWGDVLMSIGDAQRLHRETGKKIAIGDPDKNQLVASEMFFGLTELANSRMQLDGSELWLKNHSGCRPYINYDAMAARSVETQTKLKKVPYAWRTDYTPTPARLRLTHKEQEQVLLLSNQPWIALGPCLKPKAPVNKDWGFERWEALSRKLSSDFDVRQILAPGDRPLPSRVRKLHPKTFREALVMIMGASMYVGHEGGLHHAAAAGNRPAVVVFGGFVNPKATGYDSHVNLTGFDPHSDEFDASFCGTRRTACPHCRDAMNRITEARVEEEVRRIMPR